MTTTAQEALATGQTKGEVIIREIAAMLDRPSIYMGGPSQQSLRIAKAIYENYLEAIFVDAERRATEAEEVGHYANGVADLAMKHRDEAESRLSAVEARCGLMREALEEVGPAVAAISRFVGGRDLSPLTTGWLKEAEQQKDAMLSKVRSILAYPGGDQGEKEKPVADDEHWERDVFDPPAGGEGKPERGNDRRGPQGPREGEGDNPNRTEPSTSRSGDADAARGAAALTEAIELLSEQYVLLKEDGSVVMDAGWQSRRKEFVAKHRAGT